MGIPANQFRIDPNSGVPIYRQLIDQVLAMIAGGQLRAGDLLPSVRQVSDSAAVNPMTVSKAYTRLELDGVVERMRGQGMRVLPPLADGKLEQRKKQLRLLLEPVVHRGRQLGMTDEQILAVLHGVMREQKK